MVGSRTWMWRVVVVRIGLLAAPLVVVIVAVWWRWPASEPATVDVVADGPRYASLADLVGASDLVVTGSVVSRNEGRTITDPVDPSAGIRTVLLEVTVEQVLLGVAPEPLVIEHEAALLDGTPITVNGVPPPEVGERGLYFLVAGGDEMSPHRAVVGDQGRYRLAGSDLIELTSDPLAVDIATSTLADLADRIAGLPPLGEP